MTDWQNQPLYNIQNLFSTSLPHAFFFGNKIIYTPYYGMKNYI